MNLLDVLFPKRCMGCKTFGAYLCVSCKTSLKFHDSFICPVCTLSSIDGLTHPGCRGRYTLDGLRAMHAYKGPIRLLLQRFKYSPWLTDVGQTIGSLAINALEKDHLFQSYLAKKPVVVPIPLHWTKKYLRGYNQSELLGKMFAQHFHLPFALLIKRKKKTQAQFGLGREERIENVSGAFSLSSEITTLSTRYSNILLVDDVWTTGATMRVCANVLKRAGAKSVWALTIAR